MNRFEGTEGYIADEALLADVNASIVLEKPLLVRGEPGTGKTMLAYAIAEALGKKIITWHIKSTTQAKCSRLDCKPKQEVTAEDTCMGQA